MVALETNLFCGGRIATLEAEAVQIGRTWRIPAPTGAVLAVAAAGDEVGTFGVACGMVRAETKAAVESVQIVVKCLEFGITALGWPRKDSIGHSVALTERRKVAIPIVMLVT